MPPDAIKVLIYATLEGRLLVFDEPDFPDVDLQVPGGTVEPDEVVIQAARREFHEETGLMIGAGISVLGQQDYRFMRNGAEICHRRHYFHVALEGPQAEEWHHTEMTPSSGGSPIRFRFFWLALPDARAVLGYGMQDFLDRLPSMMRHNAEWQPAWGA